MVTEKSRLQLRNPNFPPNAWLRECQECGHVQMTISPEEYKDDRWRDIKCRKCKSPGSLDYGTRNIPVEDEND